MKKKGILNVELCAALAGLGHKDKFLIGDAGMPIPENVPIIDLVLVAGIPTFEQVVKAIAEEVVVEQYTIASEMPGKNQKNLAVLEEAFEGVPQVQTPHVDLKAYTAQCKFAIRTGENTPFANVVLQAGVAF